MPRSQTNPQIEKKQQAFEKLEFQEKKKTLKVLIEKINKQRLPALNQVLIDLEQNPLVNNYFCNEIFKEIIILGGNISEIEKRRTERNLLGIHEKLASMHAREEKERQEENIESLLKNI